MRGMEAMAENGDRPEQLEIDTMRKTLLAALLVLAAGAGARGAEPGLANEKLVLTGNLDSIINRRSWHRCQLRLSPDGRKLLYSRAVGGAVDGADPDGRRKEQKYDLILRDLTDGKETVLPIGPVDRGFRSVPTRFNPFDPASRSLLLYRMRREVSPDGRGVRIAMSLLRYDIAPGRAAELSLPAGRIFGIFDATGRNLVAAIGPDVHLVSLADMKLKKLGIRGFPQSVCPAGNVVSVFVPPLPRPRPPRPAPGERLRRRQGPPAELVLYDVESDKQVAHIPTHERNRSLDDLASQWTRDGRYLYYYDVETYVEGGTERLRPLVRVWDCKAGRRVGQQSEMLAVGAAPAPSSMVLVKREPKTAEAFLHDAVTGALRQIGGAIQVQHAAGGRIVYVKRDAAGNEGIYVADIDMRAKPAPTKEMTR